MVESEGTLSNEIPNVQELHGCPGGNVKALTVCCMDVETGTDIVK